MKDVWVIKQTRVVWGRGGDVFEVPWLFGKGDAAIREIDATPEWFADHGYRSEGAAVRQVDRLPFWKNHPIPAHGATVEQMSAPDRTYHYKIYRCYEIVILDDEGNQIKESDYCYGSRADAEELARHELKLMDKEGC